MDFERTLRKFFLITLPLFLGVSIFNISPLICSAEDPDNIDSQKVSISEGPANPTQNPSKNLNSPEEKPIKKNISKLADDIYRELEKIRREQPVIAQGVINKSLKNEPIDENKASNQSLEKSSEEHSQDNNKDTKKEEKEKENQNSLNKEQLIKSPEKGNETPTPEKTKKFVAVDITAESFFENQLAGRTPNVHKDDIIKLIVRLSWKGDPFAIKVEPPESFSLEGLSIEKMSPSFRTSPETERTINEFHYYLRAKERGSAAVGPITIPFMFQDSGEKNQLRTSSLSLEILSPRKNWVKILGLPIAGIALLAVFFYLVFNIKKKRREKRERELAASKEPTPEERLLSELDAQKLTLIEGDIKTFYDNCYKLTCGFISLSSGDNVRRMTAMEIMERLEKIEYDPELRDKVVNIINRCEKVRYGGYFPTPAENEDLIRDVKNLIQMGIEKRG